MEVETTLYLEIYGLNDESELELRVSGTYMPEVKQSKNEAHCVDAIDDMAVIYAKHNKKTDTLTPYNFVPFLSQKQLNYCETKLLEVGREQL